MMTGTEESEWGQNYETCRQKEEKKKETKTDKIEGKKLKKKFWWRRRQERRTEDKNGKRSTKSQKDTKSGNFQTFEIGKTNLINRNTEAK